MRPAVEGASLVIGMGCGAASLQVCTNTCAATGGAARRTAAQHRRKAQPGSQVGESRYQAARQHLRGAGANDLCAQPRQGRKHGGLQGQARGRGALLSQPASSGDGSAAAAGHLLHRRLTAGTLHSDGSSTQQAKHPSRGLSAQPKRAPAAGLQTGPHCAQPAAW